MEHVNATGQGEEEVVELTVLRETCPLNKVIIKCQFPKARTYICIACLFLYEVRIAIFPLSLTEG